MRALAPLVLFAALAGCSLLPGDDPAPAASTPSPATTSFTVAATTAPPVPLTHRQLCDWSAANATEFGANVDRGGVDEGVLDNEAKKWERLAAEAEMSREYELARIASRVAAAIRGMRFDEQKELFEKDLPAECL